MFAAPDSPMFAQSSCYNTCGLTDEKPALRQHSPRNDLSLQLAEYSNHFFAEPFAVQCRVKTQRELIKAKPKHGSCLLHRYPQVRQPRKMFHPAHFELQIPASPCCQAICLPPSRALLLFESLNPFFIQQPAQRAVKCPSAERHAPVAHLLDVLKNGIAVPRLSRQA